MLRGVAGFGPVVLILAAAAFSVSPPAGWAQEESWPDIPVAEPAVMSDLAPRSLLLDVARAGESLVAVGGRGHIVVSDDAGHSWEQVPCPTRATLTGVDFVNPQRGWAVGHDTVILATEDGGRSWDLVYSDVEAEAPLLDVRFSSATVGVALGAYGSYLETTDGGATWEGRWISDFDFHNHTLDRAPDGTLYIAAEAGAIFRSDDDGVSWQELPSPYEGSFFGTVPLADGVVLVHGLRGHIFRSEDRGATWTAIESGTVAMLTDGLQLDDGRVVLVGLGGTVLTSDDLGRTFEQVPRPDRLSIQALTVAPDGALVVVGEGGVRRLDTSADVARDE